MSDCVRPLTCPACARRVRAWLDGRGVWQIEAHRESAGARRWCEVWPKELGPDSPLLRVSDEGAP